MDTFYEFMIRGNKSEIRLESLQNYDHYELFNNKVSIENPFLTKISEGKKFYDVIAFQDTSNFAISENLYNLLTKHNITGWTSYVINIKGSKEKYFGFQVTGTCGKLEKDKGDLLYNSYRFNYNSWDGSDFFSPKETSVLLCSEKIKTLFSNNRITNIELTNINDLGSPL